MQWFAEAFGFPESRAFGEVREAFTLAATAPNSSCPPGVGNAFTLQANIGRFSGRKYHVGPFEPASVEALRTRVREQQQRAKPPRGLSFRNVAGDSYTMHLDKANAGAVFQVASQFNCLEMVGPDVRPEDGVTGYATDRTQGPACAMACPAATVYRNYFYNGRGQGGGSAMQLDTSRHVGDVVDNARQKYWMMSNGYLLPVPGGGHGLAQLSNRLRAEPGLLDKARGAAQARAHWPLPPSASSFAVGPPLMDHSRAQVGVQWDTEVASAGGAPASHRCTQVFCSALPIAYAHGVGKAEWEPLARLFLEAAYESTILVPPPSLPPPRHSTSARPCAMASTHARIAGGRLARSPPRHARHRLPHLTRRRRVRQSAGMDLEGDVTRARSVRRHAGRRAPRPLRPLRRRRQVRDA